VNDFTATADPFSLPRYTVQDAPLATEPMPLEAPFGSLRRGGLHDTYLPTTVLETAKKAKSITATPSRALNSSNAGGSGRGVVALPTSASKSDDSPALLPPVPHDFPLDRRPLRRRPRDLRLPSNRSEREPWLALPVPPVNLDAVDMRRTRRGMSLQYLESETSVR